MARVLVVDDEPTIAMVLQEVLSDEGHEVDVASDGLRALQRLEREPVPDIVLIDLFMPGTNGRSVVEAMRNSDTLRRVPVILVTGAVPREEDFPPAGSYQGVITKPFDIADVVNLVHDVLARNQ